MSKIHVPIGFLKCGSWVKFAFFFKYLKPVFFKRPKRSHFNSLSKENYSVIKDLSVFIL